MQQPGYDPEDPDAKGFEFNDQSVRKGFIRKVFAILSVSKIVFCLKYKKPCPSFFHENFFNFSITNF
jgi:hypothetical protein